MWPFSKKNNGRSRLSTQELEEIHEQHNEVIKTVRIQRQSIDETISKIMMIQKETLDMLNGDYQKKEDEDESRREDSEEAGQANGYTGEQACGPDGLHPERDQS